MYWLKSVVLKITIEITVGKVRVVYVERGQKNKVMKYGEGPGESSVHRPWMSSLRHCMQVKRQILHKLVLAIFYSLKI